jgi:signal transduction histidine kinase
MLSTAFPRTFPRTFSGVRPADAALAAALVALASTLAVMNVVSDDPTTRVDSHSWLAVPVFAATAIPVLWWRRGLIAGVLASITLMTVHVLTFGALVRCGAGLPLAFVLVFLCGAGHSLRHGLVGLLLTGVLAVVVLIRDTAAGIGALPLVLAILVGLFGIGRVLAHRSELVGDLHRRNEELRRLRDERAALEVTDDRAMLSARLEALLEQRLGQLAAAAEGGAGGDGVDGREQPERTRALLATLEQDSRQTLDDMREIVGLLRGGEVSLAPTPSVAHLDALLARRLRTPARLRIDGDPRLLPASVELSVYRIVEHLVGVLADRPSPAVDVAIRFTDSALEIRVSGPAPRSAQLRAAAARARERALLHAGSLEVKVVRGQARVVAQLPVPAGA